MRLPTALRRDTCPAGEHPLDEQHGYPTTKTIRGIPYFYWHCRDCANQRARNRTPEQRAQAVTNNRRRRQRAKRTKIADHGGKCWSCGAPGAGFKTMILDWAIWPHTTGAALLCDQCLPTPVSELNRQQITNNYRHHQKQTR